MNATEARGKFFQLLRDVANGYDATIVRTDTGVRFKISLENDARMTDKKNLIKKWDALSMELPDIKTLKKIIAERRNKIR